jgi:hypothetical protein
MAALAATLPYAAKNKLGTMAEQAAALMYAQYCQQAVTGSESRKQRATAIEEKREQKEERREGKAIRREGEGEAEIRMGEWNRDVSWKGV